MKKFMYMPLLMFTLFFSASIMTMHHALRLPSAQARLAQRAVATQLLKENKCTNLICIFDYIQAEGLKTGPQAELSEFIDAVSARVAPIIVTTNLVEHFCYWKIHVDEQGKNEWSEQWKRRIGEASFENDDWHCYAHKVSGLMLLVPKEYIKTRGIPQGADLTTQMAYCGFDVSNLDKIPDVSPSGVFDYIEQHQKKYNNFIDSFKSIFLSDASLLPYIPMWNIYATGHGSVLEGGDKTYLKAIAGLQYDDFLGIISFLAKDIKTSFLHYTSCFSGGFNLAFLNEHLSTINAPFIVSTMGINELSVTSRNDPDKFTQFFALLKDFFCEKSKAQSFLGQDPIAKIVRSVVNVEHIKLSQPFVRIPDVGVFNALFVDKQVKILTKTIARAHELEGASIDYTDPGIKILFVYPSYVGAPLRINGHTAIVSPVPQSLEVFNQSAHDIHIFEEIFYDNALSSFIPHCVMLNRRYKPIIFVIKKLHCLNYVNSGLGDGAVGPIEIENVIIAIETSYSSDYLRTITKVKIGFVFGDQNYYVSRELELGDIHNNTALKEKFALFEKLSFPIASQDDMNDLFEAVFGIRELVRLKKDWIAEMSSATGYFNYSFKKNAYRITVPLMIERLEKEIGESPTVVSRPRGGGSATLITKPRVEAPGALKDVLLRKKIDSLERVARHKDLSYEKK